MPDREKVFDALSNCIAEPKCKDCPWEDCERVGHKKTEVPVTLLLDVLELLREQETEYKPDGPDFFNDRICTRWKCTSCQYFICIEKGTPNMKYCPKCGREIKWDAAD